MDYDVIVLTETWLDDCIHSLQLFGDGYSVFRTDRNAHNSNKLRGGGVLIAVSSRLSCYRDPTPVSSLLEQLWIKIDLEGNTASLGVLYLPPDRKHNIGDIQCHVDSIGAILSHLNPNDLFLQFGDYNLSDIFWLNHEDGYAAIDLSRCHMTRASSALLDGFSFHGLLQINTLENCRGRILDLALVNDIAMNNCSISEAAEPLVPLDVFHPAFVITVSSAVPVLYDSGQDHTGYDFRRADFEALNAALSIVDWTPLNSALDIDDAVDLFMDAVHHAIVENVPRKRPPNKPPWSNSRLRLLKRRRSSALRVYSNHRSSYSKLLFNRASREYRNYNSYLYARHTHRVERNLRTNPKQFWSFVDSKRKEGGLPSSMFLGDLTADGAADKCELFSKQFKSAFNDTVALQAQAEIAAQDTPQDVFSFGPLRITEQDVARAITKLKLSYGAGPDGIPPVLLKKCCDTLLHPLAKLFNLSLECKIFPSVWKTSHLFPVYKKGDKRNVSNYRGITSLCAISKVFEIIINNALFNDCKHYISPDQHGFFPGRSVVTNLAQFTSYCIRAMDSGKQVDAVYMDLKAAFDKVDHRILLQKLLKMGVSSNLVDWFRSYLTERSLCVKIGSSLSETFRNLSGVPQGSNLGPLLFLLFINDASLVLPPGTRLFYADDAKIYVIINSIDDCHALQALLNLFGDWCTRNFLKLSIEKCQVISFSRKKSTLHYPYSLSGQVLQRVQLIRDLGVTLDDQLTFNFHYDDIISRANKQLGFVLKMTSNFKDPHCLKSLYCSLVRSILEFASAVWSPYHSSWKVRIESVQKKFVRRALRNLPWNDPVNLPPYRDRCLLLGIDTLENRRNVSQAMFVAKLLRNEIDSPSLLADLNIYAPERPLRRRNFFHLETRNSLYGQHDPVRSMMAKFNSVFHLYDFNTMLPTLLRLFIMFFRNHV